MKRILKENKNCLILLFLIILSAFLTSCGGVTPTNPVINFFSASPTTITAGDSSTLSWIVTDATSATIDLGVGSVASTTGTTSVSPAVTTTYTFTATNATGSVTATTTVMVNPPAATYGSIDIHSSPAGAKVYLDGVYTSYHTPIVLTNIAAGIHTIKLYLYHYKTKEETDVSVTASETTYLNWSLTYAPIETYTLQPGSEGKDAYVETCISGYFPSSSSLVVGYLFGVKFRTYLEFDLSPNPFPAGAVVTNAYLRLYQQGNSPPSGPLSIGVYQVLNSWGENSITWNTQPTSSSEAEDISTISSSTTWRTYNVHDLVKGWLYGSISNYGLLLKPINESSNDGYALFPSSDYTYDTSIHPKLEINYFVP
jgi:hypothetical protein